MNAAANILIVDDEPANRRLLEALLLPEGYQTRTAGSGKEALAEVARQAPDLVLLDVMMPGMDGYQVASKLKADPGTAHIPIIMVTALIDAKARLAGLSAGAEEFLSKPVDRAELWLRVRNLLRLKELGQFFRNHNQILEQQVRERTVELQRFRSAMDATADAIFLVSRKTMQFVEVNATACTMLGYSREELFALGPSRLSGGTRAELEREYDGLIRGDRSHEQHEGRLWRKDGTSVQVEVFRHVLAIGSDWIVVAAVRDITERKETQERLHQLAHFDVLTGLPNRTLFRDTLERALAHASRSERQIAVLFVDVDQFKKINDTLGHAMGDELLQEIAARLVRSVRVRDTVARLGGDEFGLMLLMKDGHLGAALVAAKVQAALRVPFELRGQPVSVTASIGITIQPDDADDAETLLRYADTAMYRAKHAGRDTFRFFTAQMNAEVSARAALEAGLRLAVENEEFVLHYQPKLQLATGRIAGVEALLRWQRPGHGLVLPDEFVTVLEEMGLITQVGSWVLAAACRQIAQWRTSAIGPVQVAVNVSGQQFIDADLEADVHTALDQNDVPANLLELELTEGSMMANTERTVATLANLKQLGVHISIDDFGTGYSSLAYLRRFPIDKLKIDIAFVRDITNSDDDASIALAIIRLAKSLRLDVIAEGVERSDQRDYLQRHGCDQIQGHLFSQALSAAQMERLLIRDRQPRLS